eukprot:4494180-Amphidinium_carterae.1
MRANCLLRSCACAYLKPRANPAFQTKNYQWLQQFHAVLEAALWRIRSLFLPLFRNPSSASSACGTASES